MTVRGKFVVNSVELFASPVGSGAVKLVASNSKVGDNKDWSQYTPSGQITMMITNPDAFVMFKDAIGKAFYVDFNVVEQP